MVPSGLHMHKHIPLYLHVYIYPHIYEYIHMHTYHTLIIHKEKEEWDNIVVICGSSKQKN